MNALLVPLLFVLLVVGSSPAVADTITVTSLTDNGESGTFRWALARARTNGVADSILFDLPLPYVIEPTNQLPAVGDSQPTWLLGSSQPGYTGVPIVTVRGTLAGASASGLVVTSAGNRVQALVIAAFSNYGVYVQSAHSNEIQGCYIVGNGSSGVDIWAGRGNVIGGTIASDRNVISSNYYGVQIRGSQPHTNRIVGNYIGTDPTGSNAWPNSVGIFAQAGAGLLVGGSDAGEGNVISGNTGSGILVLPSASACIIRGNFIGTDASGSQAVGNGLNGVEDQNVGGITIGGTNAGDRNVISGNGTGSGGQGVYLFGADARNNLVVGNYIGVDATGLKAISNRNNGVQVLGGGSNTISGNVISGNGDAGVRVYGYSYSCFCNVHVTGTVIRGNYIGTDRTGTNALRNSGAGIALIYSREAVIGGTNTADGNVISGNEGGGIDIYDSYLDVVQNNLIGVGADGITPVSNNYFGMSIQATGMTVRANVIAFNSGRGVVVFGVSASVSNAILGNRMYSNSLLGIDIGYDGVSTNDVGDPDIGNNSTQNFPIVSVAWRGSTIITGRLNSVAGRTYRLEFFSSDQCDPSGYGEGQQYIGDTNVTTDGSGNAFFRYFSRITLPTGRYVTATATDVERNETSEFSPCVRVIPAPDTDNDKMPDFWEILFGLNPNVSNAVTADADGDKVYDIQEYLADTAANDPTQYLHFKGIWNSQGPIVMFTASVGRVYSLDYTTNARAPVSWVILNSDLDGFDGDMLVNDNNPTHSDCVYRVRARLP